MPHLLQQKSRNCVVVSGLPPVLDDSLFATNRGHGKIVHHDYHSTPRSSADFYDTEDTEALLSPRSSVFNNTGIQSLDVICCNTQQNQPIKNAFPEQLNITDPHHHSIPTLFISSAITTTQDPSPAIDSYKKALESPTSITMTPSLSSVIVSNPSLSYNELSSSVHGTKSRICMRIIDEGDEKLNGLVKNEYKDPSFLTPDSSTPIAVVKRTAEFTAINQEHNIQFNFCGVKSKDQFPEQGPAVDSSLSSRLQLLQDNDDNKESLNRYVSDSLQLHNSKLLTTPRNIVTPSRYRGGYNCATNELSSSRMGLATAPILRKRILSKKKEMEMLDRLLLLTAKSRNRGCTDSPNATKKKQIELKKVEKKLTVEYPDYLSISSDDSVPFDAFSISRTSFNATMKEKDPKKKTLQATPSHDCVQFPLDKKSLSLRDRLDSRRGVTHESTLDTKSLFSPPRDYSSPATLKSPRAATADPSSPLFSSNESSLDPCSGVEKEREITGRTPRRRPPSILQFPTFGTSTAHSSLTNCTPIFKATQTKLAKTFKRDRDTLSKQWYNIFNNTVFKDRLPEDMKIIWNPRLTRTAGQTMMSQKSLTQHKSCSIHLSCRVLDREQRHRSTLLHEMCHAAQFLLEHEQRPAHGPGFQRWARIGTAMYPDIPVTVTHNYDIHEAYQYQCESCGHVYVWYPVFRLWNDKGNLLILEYSTKSIEVGYS